MTLGSNNGGHLFDTTFTAEGVIYSDANGVLTSTAAGTTGQVLQSAGNASPPVYSTATYPATAGTSGNVITSNGTNFSSSAPAASSKITTFNGAGTYSWTIDPRTISVEFYGWGGGGGGGSGRCGSTTAAGGGSGGGAGWFNYQKVQAGVLTGSPYTVTVGSGSAGGISVNAVTTNGNPGTAGNPSSVGTIFAAGGGLAGAGGTTTTAASQGSFGYILSQVVSGQSSGGGVQSGVGSTPNNQVYGWSGSGAGGAGYTTTTAKIGGVGGAITDTLGATLVAGGLAGANTGATAGNGNPPVNQLLVIGGSGGGSGGHDGTTIAGSGGNGAAPGGGGGGGAGNLSSNASGAGGSGADGKIIIIEYF